MAHSLIIRIGKFCGWLLIALVVVQFTVVLARYLFHINYLWGQEIALYLHGAIFMLSAGWSLLAEKHVRLDVLSERFEIAKRRRIELFGTVFLLLPMMGLIIFTSVGYVWESWSILESSPEISGLGGRYLVKTLIPVFGLLMVLAAITKLKRLP
ncbi:MAG: TRAP transporter small permease subunit [Rhizobiaceae bacterium]